MPPGGGAPRPDVDTSFLREFFPPTAPADGDALNAWLASGTADPHHHRRFVFCVTLHQRGVDALSIEDATGGYCGARPGTQEAKTLERVNKARALPRGYASRAPTLRIEAVYEHP